MTKISISIRKGKGNLRHNIDFNYRMKLSHTDSSSVDKNHILINENIKDVFHKLFDKSLLAYNAKYIHDSKHQNRIISNYYQHIKSGKQEKTHHELIIEIGKKNDGISNSTKIQILKEIVKTIQTENPNLYIFQATIHIDEPDSGPHLHLDYVPYVTNQKRGLSTRVSHDKALAEMGYKKEKCISSLRDTAPNIYNGFRNRLEHELEKIMQNYDLQHVYIHNGKEHEDHREWRKKESYNKQLDLTIQKKEKELRQIDTKVSKIEKIKQITCRENKFQTNEVILNSDDYKALKKTAMATATVHRESIMLNNKNVKLAQENKSLIIENSELVETNQELVTENKNLHSFLDSVNRIMMNQFGIDLYAKKKQILEVGVWLSTIASRGVKTLQSTTFNIFDRVSKVYAEIGLSEPLRKPDNIVGNTEQESKLNIEEKNTNPY